jgi:hypothetical protein
MGGVPRGIGLRDHAAEGVAQHNGLLDADRVAEGANVVAPLRQVPVRRVAMLAAPVAAVVEIDELGDICEMGKGGLEGGMVTARAAVQQQDSGALAHIRTVGDEFRAVNIEEEAGVVDGDMHGFRSVEWGAHWVLVNPAVSTGHRMI